MVTCEDDALACVHVYTHTQGVCKADLIVFGVVPHTMVNTCLLPLLLPFSYQ